MAQFEREQACWPDVLEDLHRRSMVPILWVAPPRQYQSVGEKVSQASATATRFAQALRRHGVEAEVHWAPRHIDANGRPTVADPGVPVVNWTLFVWVPVKQRTWACALLVAAGVDVACSADSVARVVERLESEQTYYEALGNELVRLREGET